jgi:hypothetical protein
MRPTDKCYWCGAQATSVDHVPPENLFPKDKKKNLITVPSCKKHNEDLTKEDEIFRFYLQACAESADSLKLFEDKTLRSITRPGGHTLAKKIFGGSVPISVQGHDTRALEVDPIRQELYFEKITRGIFFHLFGRQLDGAIATFSPSFMSPGLDYAALSKLTLGHILSPEAIDGVVGQPEIFRYRYFHKKDAEGEAFLIRMTFYGSVQVIGMFSKKNGG